MQSARKAVGAFITPIVSGAIAWVVLHTGLDLDPDTSVTLTVAIVSVITAKIVHYLPNEPA